MVAAALAVLTSACTTRWHVPADKTDSASVESEMQRELTAAAADREEQYTEALHPGTRERARRASFGRGDFASFRREGRALFGLDTPWHEASTPLPVLPIHTAALGRTADATRCAGCHHRGGEGGAGSFSDLAFFEGLGDDVTTARRALPRSLAGAALLELAARGHADMHPFGWRPGRPRTLRAMVAWSIEHHLGETASDDEVDAITAYLASLPPPVEVAPPAASLVGRAERGYAKFVAVGCANCHAPALRFSNAFLELSHGRNVDVSALLESTRDGFVIRAYSDLRAHHLGGKLGITITPPLWGIANRGPFLHDGSASSIREAILAHDGEAARARDAFAREEADSVEIELFLLTLTRGPKLAKPL
jgi:mono/diheme cytochrome c family protein